MRAGSILVAALLAVGCVTVTQTHRTTQPVAIESLGMLPAGSTYRLAVGAFRNRSPYLQDAFADGVDPLGAQAQSLLKMHLKLTGRFMVVDAGAPVTIIGDVTQFGRRETAGAPLFGSRQQVAYASVALNVVDVNGVQVMYAVEGAGEYPLADREAVAFGTVAGYDASLNGKVLNRAILQAVDNMVAGLDRGEWSPMPVR